MPDYDSDTYSTHELRFSLRSFLVRDWPYLAMLTLALFGVAYTSIARQAMTTYWIALAPFFAIFCVITRWRDVAGEQRRWQLIKTEGFHWIAVIVAMYLVFVSDVRQMMSSDASALMVLTLLALGTFLAGVHIGAWRICLVGTVLAAAVPAIAWLEQATLLLFLAAIVIVSVVALVLRFGRRNFMGS
jgi:hypothetical protein